MTNPIELCNCISLAKELLFFFRDVVTDLSEEQLLWKKLEVFMKQYSCQTNERHGWKIAKSCSERISTNILNRFIPCRNGHPDEPIPVEDRKLYGTADLEIRHGVKVLTVLTNFIGKNFFLDRIDEWDFDRDTWMDKCIWKNDHWAKISCNTEYIACVRVLVALNGNTEYMKLLANLDLLFGLNSDDDIEIFLRSEFRSMSVQQEFLSAVGEDLNTFNKEIDINCMAEYFLLSAKLDESPKRIYLAAIAVRATALQWKKEINEAKKHIYCLKMYFAITGDPFLTMNEVRILLYVSFNVLEKLHLFESFCEEFTKIMPECSTKWEPRSLTDLVRCQIRKDLRKCCQPLPVAVAKLDLAQPLKEFILGNVVQMSRKSGNVSTEDLITVSELDEIDLCRQRLIDPRS